MILRCVLDGLILPAKVATCGPTLTAYDGDEGFAMEALEAMYYEVVAATEAEWLTVERAHFRLLRRAADFRWHEG